MLINDVQHTIDTWIKELEQYTFPQLCVKPSPSLWSLGQMYTHLIDDTNYFIDQITIAVSNEDHAMEEASPGAKTMFLNNDFPDAAIEGAPSNASIPQPGSKEQLISGLIHLKNKLHDAEILISESAFKGKTKHPGLGYFTAREWYQFAEMHFRHHFRQKKRIDSFLKTHTGY